MNNRLTFLHFLFNNANYNEITKARVYNQEYDTTRIIGSSPRERNERLSGIQFMIMNKSFETGNEKKKSTFSLYRM